MSTETSVKYADLLRQTKDQHEAAEIDALVASANASFARKEADIMSEISKCGLELKRAQRSTSIDIVNIISLRRNLKALEEDLADVRTLRSELF